MVMSFLGIGNYLTSSGINYNSLMIFCLMWGIGGSLISLLISKQLAKWSMGVRIITNVDTEHRKIVEMVHRLASKAGLPQMPEVGIYESDDLNAFATGPSKSNSLIAISTGLRYKMNEDEIEGVLAHEVAHIANGDMVTMALVQGVVNAFVMFLSRIMAFSISQAMRKDDDDSPVSPLVNGVITFALDIVLGLLALPLVAWFSRYREFRADRGGADLAGTPKMIAALEMLKSTYSESEDVQAETSQAFRAMQISSRSRMIKLFSTHPPLEERVMALKNGN
jgi:heat shock protein HtpX